MIIKKYSFSKIFFWAGIISLSIIYMILWAKMIRNPAERTGTDFIAFYSAGRVAQEHGISQVYNIAYQQSVQEKLLGISLKEHQPLLYNHIPFLIPLLILISQDDYLISFSLWALIQIALYGISFYYLSQLVNKGRTKRNFILSVALFFPIFISILLGQDTAFLFLGISLFLYGIFKKKNLLAGGGLALTTVRPHLTLVLALPLLFKNKKTFGYFTVLASLLALFSIKILGIEGVSDFLNILTISGSGKWYGMKEVAMLNFTGLLTREFRFFDTDTIHLLSWTAYFLTIIILSLVWIRTKEIKKSHLSISLILSLFFAPHLHYHDLSLLIIPIIFLLDSGKLPISPKNLALVPLAISFLLIFTQSIPFLYYSLPYLLMLTLSLYFLDDIKTHKNKDSFSNA